MAGKRKIERKIDKVRAGNDGHEFHHVWTARMSVQLLWPDTELIAIAVEGLSPSDQAKVPAATVEVADLTLYYGKQPGFENASKTVIAQFKYSIAKRDADFRASDAKETLKKFGKTYRSFKTKYGAKTVEDKLEFHLITNQPVYEPLVQAIEALQAGEDPTRSAKVPVETQAQQIKAASGLSGRSLAAFARKLKIVGRSDGGGDGGGAGRNAGRSAAHNAGLSQNLPDAKNALASLLVDWSATNDSLARARLGQLQALVREKAGDAGTGRNLIMRMDVLAALQIGDLKDLLPCPCALADVGPVLQRQQLDEAVIRLGEVREPLLIHATAGVGKTVFMSSLAGRISDHFEVVFFDCFGGGAYRSPEDARHMPKRGLIHIANTLAFKGLCDPILPGSDDVQTLLRTFRARLTQCVRTLSRRVAGQAHVDSPQLVIFIDAIDNAVFASDLSGEDCFPVKLIEALHTEPIDGVKLVVSCRTERKPETYAPFDEFELHPFTKDETHAFLRARIKNATADEVSVGFARSGGNPRILSYLVEAGRGLFEPSQTTTTVSVEDLIQKQIEDALASAQIHGYKRADLEAFLAGLTVLPPPVPLEEYAAAHKIEVARVKSFAADLSPLLERTRHGLIILDEPTETFIHNRYATPQSRKTLKRLASNLLASQDVSVYAARALPGLLQKLDDGKQLFELAFDDRMPASVTSRVGKSNIRYARLMAATRHAACKADWDKLVRLLVELSAIAQVDQRGSDYIVEYPDLVVAARDVDAHRRLFEIRTAWPGKRHACLSVVNALSGDLDEATRHAKLNRDWIAHYLRQERKKFDQDPAPDQSDIAAYSFFLISVDRMQDAARCLLTWRDWFAFEVTEVVLGYGRLAELLGTQPAQRKQLTSRIDQFVGALAGVGTGTGSGIGAITAALSFHEAGHTNRKALCMKLASLCKTKTTIDFAQRRSHDNTFTLEDGLRKSAVIAVSLGLGVQARAISLRARHERPKVWAFRDGFGASGHSDVFGYIFRLALLAAVDKRPIHEKDLLPQELVPICSSIPKACVGKVFREKVLAKLDKLRGQAAMQPALQPALQLHVGDDLRRSAARFLNSRLEPLLTLVQALAAALAASTKTIDKRFVRLVQAWEETRQSRDHYQARGVARVSRVDPFFRSLGFDAVLLVLWSRHELKRSSVDRMLAAVHDHINNPVDLTRIVTVLAGRPALYSVAAQLAIEVDKLLQSEDDATYRASLYGVLGRAILPASRDDATFYFQKGLEQMDAIGSADFQFTNELLLFAANIKGDEVDECVSHVLSNICELTMSDEPEKFNWGAYGRGMANVAGISGLAKLSRWDDRNRIALGNTLQNYLTGLVAAQKISPRDAVCLNCLASPVEYFDAGTKEFAQALQARKTQGALDADTVTELITQFVDNNPGFASQDTLAALHDISVRVLTSEHDLTRYLESGLDNHSTVKEGLNIRTGSVGGAGGTGGTNWADPTTNTTAAKRKHDNRTALERIAADTDPIDMSSLVTAIDDFNALGNLYDLKGDFFASLREKVPFSACGQYIHNVAGLEHLSFYRKLTELKEAKQAWEGTSAALSGTDHGLAQQLIRAYAKDLVGDGLFSGSGFGSIIHEVSELTGESKSELVRELINACSSSDAVIPGSVWLAFASLICSEAEEGQGQEALKRLLTSEVGSEVARIASHVTDGPWEAGLYPEDDFVDVASGLIWRMLGSPSAVDRWRAAHCIRRFAKFERWDIVDKLVGDFDLEGAGPFQAPELNFYYLHARLWLLIALARAALDHPVQVSGYKNLFLSVVMNRDVSHVLMQHFAAKALVACVDLGNLTLDPDVLDVVRNVDKSPFGRAPTKGAARFYLDDVRPKSVAKPAHCFQLEYDFRKYDAAGLGRVFSKGCWEVEDTISAIVKEIDPTVSHMSDDGGREQRGQSSFEMTTRWHGYGQQLGYHGLFFAAGKLLATHPVTEGLWGEDDPWAEWLDRYLLTHKDGFWLSDGTDRIPADVAIRLLEPEGEGYALTGDRKIIMALAGLDVVKGVGRELIVHGNWHSSDGVEVRLSSALVTPNEANQLASKLIEAKPMSVWLPVFQEDGEAEYSRREPDGYTPWIVCPTGEPRLDEHDPYGVSEANLRPRLTREYRELCKLTPQDAFGRHWQNNRGTRSLTAQAWGRSNTNREYGPLPGVRLSCKSGLLKKVLASDDKELLILFKLQRYEKETYSSSGRYLHSIAVVRIDKSLRVEYFGGRVNHVHRP